MARKLKVSEKTKLKQKKELGFLEIDGVRERVLGKLDKKHRYTTNYLEIGDQLVYNRNSVYFKKAALYNVLFEVRSFIAINLECGLEDVIRNRELYAPEIEPEKYAAYMKEQYSSESDEKIGDMIDFDDDSRDGRYKYDVCMMNGVFILLTDEIKKFQLNKQQMPKLYDGILRVYINDLAEYCSEKISAVKAFYDEEYSEVPVPARNVLIYLLARFSIAEGLAKALRCTELSKELTRIWHKVINYGERMIKYFKGEEKDPAFLRIRLTQLSLLLADSEDWGAVKGFVTDLDDKEIYDATIDLEEQLLERFNVTYSKTKQRIMVGDYQRTVKRLEIKRLYKNL